MAARSPIVLSSSSPDGFRSLWATPHSASKNSSSVADPSYLNLADASTLYRRHVTGLQSGSRAQQLPQIAAAGFSSAATLWKTQKSAEAESSKVGGEKKSAQDCNDETQKPEKRAGRLVRPRKTQDTTAIKRQKSADAQSPQTTVTHTDLAVNVHFKASSPAPQSQLTGNAETKKVRKPSTDLSVYDFDAADDEPLKKNTKSGKLSKKPHKARTKKKETPVPGELAKKPRKRAASGSGRGEVPAKKPKKRFTKSESLVLNSDEPNEAQETVDAPPSQNVAAAGEWNVDNEEINVPGVICGAAANTSAVSKEDLAKLLSAKERPVLESAEDSGPAFFDKTPEPENIAAFLNVTQNTLKDAAQVENGRPIGSPRRLSGKPVEDNASPTSGIASPSSTAESTPVRVSLPSLISSFGYTHSNFNAASSEQAITGETLTTKRRIDLADTSTVGPFRRKVSGLPSANPAKKPKAPKKKPQTITALATKAYQAPTDAEPDQPSLSASAFLAPQAAQDSASSYQETAAAAPKPMRTRKPRAKKLDADGVPIKPAKLPRAKKGQGRVIEVDHSAPLYSPEKARGEEQRQDFLFGTSSQLAAEQSPRFIRETNAALQKSECPYIFKAGLSPECNSRIKVASAPDGTNLSVGQADRDLWCSAARDHEGDVMAKEREPQAENIGTLWTMPKMDAANMAVVRTWQGDLLEQNVESTVRAGEDHNPAIENSPQQANQSAGVEEQVFIDLSHTSPIVGDDSGIVLEQPPLANSHPPSDDSWMILWSDGQTPQKPFATEQIDSVPIRSPTHAQTTVPALRQSAISPFQQRSALQMLDANVSLAAKTSPLNDALCRQQRAVNAGISTTTTASPHSYPRQESSLTAKHALKSPKMRGRPRKKVVAPYDIAQLEPGVPTLQLAASSTSVNMDEISDSDSPITPSPPRRPANSSSPATPPLALESALSPSTKTTALALAKCTLKPDDLNWSVIAKDLFPRITATVRSTPPSTELNNPTWHEKILLYDPIVLEDLTCWLNEQNVKVTFRRLKPKSRKKRKESKGVVPQESEYETLWEELKPWMVQKWCEENSICCLWKEGLRGGVRTRY